MTTSDEIKKYRALVESAMHAEAATDSDSDLSAHEIAQALHNMWPETKKGLTDEELESLRDIVHLHDAPAHVKAQALDHWSKLRHQG